MDRSIILLKDVKKTYIMDEVKVQALKNVDLDVREKDFLAIMGPSGSGKSTLMNVI